MTDAPAVVSEPADGPRGHGAAPVPEAANLVGTVHADPRWVCVDLISDLHLHPGAPATLALWRDYLARTPAQAVFILGDLFEVWVGDDALTEPFEAGCAATLLQASARCALYFMHGNRDFLFGSRAARACGMLLLADPCLLAWGEQRWLLSHGDALCLEDVAYQSFRREVRSRTWQQDFLGRPMAQRRAVAGALRAQSQARKASGAPYADVDVTTARAWLAQARAPTLIHGHTHRPGHTPLSGDPVMDRWCLSDWDVDGSQPPRAQVLRLQPGSAPQALNWP